MPSLKFTPRNLEKLGIILMILLLVFRPGFIKKFSNNLIGKMLLLGGIVSVASHNKMHGLLAAFTYVVCVEMSSEGLDEEDAPGDRDSGCKVWGKEPNVNWEDYLSQFSKTCGGDSSFMCDNLSGNCCVPSKSVTDILNGIIVSAGGQGREGHPLDLGSAVGIYNAINTSGPEIVECQMDILNSSVNTNSSA